MGKLLKRRFETSGRENDILRFFFRVNTSGSTNDLSPGARLITHQQNGEADYEGVERVCKEAERCMNQPRGLWSPHGYQRPSGCSK